VVGNVAGDAPVEWVPGYPQRWRVAGLLVILWGAVGVAIAVTSLLGLSQHGGPSETGSVIYVLVSGGILFPGVFAYSRFMPTTARLGIMPEGVIVEAGFPNFPGSVFRQGYRWGELELEGRCLLLPQIRSRAPRMLRLSAAQLDRLGPRIAAR
jgi:hypothetical protein